MKSTMNIFLRAVIIIIIFLGISDSIFAGTYTTSLTTNTTQPSIALDPASGNPQIGDFGSIGMYNGRLNYTIPLLGVGGRGDAGYTISLDLNRTWVFDHHFEEYSDENNHLISRYTLLSTGEWWQQGGLKSGPGVVVPRFNPGPVPTCSTNQIYYFTETSFTFAASDGSEITLLSQAFPSGVGIQCNTYSNDPDLPGTFNTVSLGNVFTSVDGSAIKFITDQVINSGYTPTASGFLYFPNGTRYRIDNGGVSWIEDRNGNRTSSSSGIIDSNGRQINIFKELQNSEYGLHDKITYTGFDGQPQSIIITYGLLGDALRSGETLKTDHQLFGYLPCPSSSCPPTLINPTVVKSVIFPGNLTYRFEYNSYEELARVETPQGAAFEYDWGGSLEGGDARGLIEYPAPYGGEYVDFFRQVLEKRVYANGGSGSSYDFKTVIQKSSPFPIYTYNNYPDMTFTRTVSSYGRNNTPMGMQKHKFWGHPLEPGPKPEGGIPPEPVMYPIWWKGRNFETLNYESDGVTLVSRNIKQWTSETASGINATDTRLAKQIMIAPEGDKATVVLQEIEYDNNGNYDPNYFSHLNVKRSKAYNYKVVNLNTAKTADLIALINLFGQSDLASVSETDYLYDAGYKERHILGLPTETRVMNPASPTQVLAKSQTVFDEQSQFYSMVDYGSTVGYATPTGNYAHLRGNATTNRTWFAEENRWIETHTQFDNFGNVRKVWDSSGDQSRFIEIEYSSNFYYTYPTRKITPAPDPTGIHGMNETSTVTTDYDFWTGVPLSVTDANGQITSYEYDNLARPKKMIPPAGGAISETEFGETPGNLFVKGRTQVDTQNWAESTTFFDNLGRPYKSQTKDLQGDVFSEIQYDDLGRIKQVSNPYRQGEQKLWGKPRYDSRGRVVETFAPAPDGQTGASNGIVEFGISTIPGFIGNYYTATDASGRKARYLTNVYGQITRFDEPTGNNDPGSLASPNQATYYTYNIKGELVKIQQDQQNRYFMYDSLGRLIRVRQPEQTPNQNLATTGNPENNQWTLGFTYDVHGNVITVTDAKDTVITNSYDKAGRLKTSSYSDGITPQDNYYYDGKGLGGVPQFARGNLTKVTNGVSETRYTSFDNYGGVLTSQQITDGQTYNFQYKYDSVGNLIEQTYPSGRVIKTHLDTDGGLAAVSSKTATSPYKTFISNFDYTATGGIKAMMLGNGRWETASFNERQQLTQIGLGNTSTNTSLWKVNYEYGELNTDGSVDTSKNIGSIAKQTITVPGGESFVQTYKYDELNRLTEAKENANSVNGAENWKQTFQYDRYGNRTGFYQKIGTIELPINNQTKPQVDPTTNRFTTAQGYVYDANGNLVQDAQNRGFTYNGDDKQTEVRDLNIPTSPQNPDANLIGRYFYDAEGKRVKKITNTETTIFVYDAAGALVAEYSTQINPEPTTSYMTTDHLGSPRVVTDKNGNVISRRDFMPFGEEILAGVGARDTTNLKYSSNGIDNIRQRFTSYEKDIETELDFAEARMYKNDHGRFTSPDPMLASTSLGNPQTFNRYVYVGNNPINITDPSGLNWCRNSAGNTYFSGIDSSGNNIACESGYDIINGQDATLVAGDLSHRSTNGQATAGSVLRFHANGSVTVMEPSENDATAIARATGTLVERTFDPIESVGTNPLSVIQQKKIEILPLCQTGQTCSPPSAPLPTLDIEKAPPLAAVEGLARLAEGCSMIPGAGTPCGIIAAIVRGGQGDVSGAGENLIGAIPGGGLLKNGRKASNFVNLKPLSSSGNYNLAIGLQQNGGLQRFAKATNSKTYVDFFGPTAQFNQEAFKDLAASAKNIYINKGNGFSFRNFRQWVREGKPFRPKMVTNWEIDFVNKMHPDKIRYIKY